MASSALRLASALALPDLLDALVAARAEVERLTPRWVPVAERMPERRELVWIWSSEGVQDLGVWNGQKWLDWYRHEMHGVTHWSPLIVPPAPEVGKP